ncbi:uncharacterized protein LOC132334783 isoform X13 [Haemorhous mexicanus]|uniref:uncharacterized protein LOC132334783 isoform X13 n=1 Tax=Haemorhous mexicanus TaxID=30427 RepID=UPI0028BD8199|nr:uncharacterized protein LOC132334783 isoform X13 [Haemorhous mexicanus]
MKVAVLSVALLFSILLCPPAQAKGLRMPLDRCPPPKMPGPPRGPLPNQGSWSESGAGPVPQLKQISLEAVNSHPSAGALLPGAVSPHSPTRSSPDPAFVLLSRHSWKEPKMTSESPLWLKCCVLFCSRSAWLPLWMPRLEGPVSFFLSSGMRR